MIAMIARMSVVAMAAMVIFVLLLVLLLGMLLFSFRVLFVFFSMLFTLGWLPVPVTLPPVWMVLVCRLGLMVIPPIMLVQLVVAFVGSPVAILPRGWLTHRLPILRVTVRPTLEVRVL